MAAGFVRFWGRERDGQLSLDLGSWIFPTEGYRNGHGLQSR